jgi:transmembrane sensor
MNYINYQVEDFVLDPKFQQWVYLPNQETNRFWTAFMAKNPEKKPDVESARNILLTFQLDKHTLSPLDVRELKLAIHEKISEADQATYSEKFYIKPNYGRVRPWLKLAAAFICLLVVSFFAIQFLSPPHTINYATGYNQTKTVLLPDSSTVILNASSVLSVVGTWEGASDRVVRLEGEAFFKVKKKPMLGNQKFIVHTENANIEVLGTQFNVNNRREKTQVVLSSGKVKLRNNLIPDTEVYMMPGELAALSQDEPEIIHQKVQTENYTSWIENKLILENTSMKTVAEMLEDNYGFEVIIEDEKQAERKFSATSTLTLNDVNTLLDLIEKSFHVKVIKKGRQLIIKSN